MHGATGRVTADLVGDTECQSCEEGSLTQVLYQVSSVHPCASAHRTSSGPLCPSSDEVITVFIVFSR